MGWMNLATDERSVKGEVIRWVGDLAIEVLGKEEDKIQEYNPAKDNPIRGLTLDQIFQDLRLQDYKIKEERSR